MKRILSGTRPTGRAHIGHLFGAFSNWAKLQDTYECFFEVADIHALTTSVNKEEMRPVIRELVADWIACGIDPKKSTLFIQSLVPQHSELHLFLSMLMPVNWLRQNPTLKDMMRNYTPPKEDATTAEIIEDLYSNLNYGLLGYPVLQAADILIYKSDAVPVGEDQLPHIEMTREIARKFNNAYGNIFPEPESIVNTTPRVPGLDGRKMSKSLNNTIIINESLDSIKSKISQAFTDPLKIRKTDPGHTDGCIVFAYHKLVTSSEAIPVIKKECEEGTRGCVSCKAECSGAMNKFIEPFREKRTQININDIDNILEEGSKKAREVASATLKEVKEAMKLW
jgi:tryptophanyl-tRNA synthetase